MVKPGPVSWSYGYDYENRLTAVSSSQGYTGAYTLRRRSGQAYSADGLRLRVQESNHAYPDRWFQYDGERPVLEGTLSGDTYTTTAKYLWEGESYYSPLVSEYVSNAWRHYLYDGLGSTRQLLDASQNVTDTYAYEAFGNLKGSSGSMPNPYRYVGSLGYYQTGSSLAHPGARYYWPEVGRFGQRDQVRSRERNAVNGVYTL
jgi:RHS repeat-associated protein